MKCNKTILGFKYCGEIKNGELAYAWCRGQIPEHEDLALVSCFFPNVKSFFDIGANTGSYCVLAAALGNGRISVHAFEPQEKCVEALNATIESNQWEEKLKSHMIGLSNKNAIERIYCGGDISTGATFASHAEGEFFDIQTMRLDDFCTKNQIEEVDFIKIDVEGYEFEVLEGGVEMIKKSLPAIYIEILKKTVRKNETMQKLLDFGYTIYHLINSELVEYRPEMAFSEVDMFLCVTDKHDQIISQIERLLENGNLLYEPFRQSSLPPYKKIVNYNLLKLRYWMRGFIYDR